MSGAEGIIVAPVVVGGTMLAIKVYEMARDKYRRRKAKRLQKRLGYFALNNSQYQDLYGGNYPPVRGHYTTARYRPGRQNNHSTFDDFEQTIEQAQFFIQGEVNKHFQLGDRFNQGDVILQHALQRICTAIQREVVMPLASDLMSTVPLPIDLQALQVISTNYSRDLVQELWSFRKRFEAPSSLTLNLRYENDFASSNMFGFACPNCPVSSRIFAKTRDLHQYIKAKHSDLIDRFQGCNGKTIGAELVTSRFIEELDGDDDYTNPYAITSSTSLPLSRIGRNVPERKYLSKNLHKKPTSLSSSPSSTKSKAEGSTTGPNITALCAATAAATAVVVLSPHVAAVAAVSALGVATVGWWKGTQD